VYLPFAYSDSHCEVSGARVHHAHEVGLPVGELVDQGLEVDVGHVDSYVYVVLRNEKIHRLPLFLVKLQEIYRPSHFDNLHSRMS